MNAKGFIGALALVAALVAVARGQQIENTYEDPIFWKGAHACYNLEREPDDRNLPDCLSCCSKYGFTNGVYEGKSDGYYLHCICASYTAEVAAGHAAESAKDKDYASCAQYGANNEHECTSCCQSLGFKTSGFSGLHRNGTCGCMGAKDTAYWRD